MDKVRVLGMNLFLININKLVILFFIFKFNSKKVNLFIFKIKLL